jgi:protein subunit release factor B
MAEILLMKELLFSVTKKDFDIQYFCTGGPGGQSQNKTASGVRIVHKDSGAVAESREERQQHQNLKIAFKRLTSSKKFQLWLKIKSAEIITKETVEQIVDRMLAPENIQTEVKDDKGKWTIQKDLTQLN